MRSSHLRLERALVVLHLAAVVARAAAPFSRRCARRRRSRRCGGCRGATSKSPLASRSAASLHAEDRPHPAAREERGSRAARGRRRRRRRRAAIGARMRERRALGVERSGDAQLEFVDAAHRAQQLVRRRLASPASKKTSRAAEIRPVGEHLVAAPARPPPGGRPPRRRWSSAPTTAAGAAGRRARAARRCSRRAARAARSASPALAISWPSARRTRPRSRRAVRRAAGRRTRASADVRLRDWRGTAACSTPPVALVERGEMRLHQLVPRRAPRGRAGRAAAPLEVARERALLHRPPARPSYRPRARRARAGAVS